MFSPALPGIWEFWKKSLYKRLLPLVEICDIMSKDNHGKKGKAAMKTVFIINPKAGKGENAEELRAKIRSIASAQGTDVEIYVTKCPGDGTQFVKQYIAENGSARFIACGGDGTLNEVLNGVVGSVGSEIGVLPAGTGNDFCRNFAGDFSDIEAILAGSAVPCDAISYTIEEDGKQKTGYCANMFNIGFDCNVADTTAVMKQKPFISGSLAYLLSIFTVLIKKKGADLAITLDGEEFHRGKLLLTSIANGCFCGGGIKSNPLAEVSDGMLNTNIIYNISRLNFLTKLPYYMKGTHIRLPGIEKIIFTGKYKKIGITPLSGTMRLCIDGEIINAGKTEFEVIPGAFLFVVPKK